jgi:hypothetical protein
LGGLRHHDREGLAADAILLGGEVEGDIVSLKDVVDGRGGSIVGGITDREGEVTQAEGVWFGVGGALAVLPGAEKEEESHDGQIGDGALVVGGAGVLGDKCLEMDEQL